MTQYYPITAPYPVFTDIDGMPLENGYIYVGLENKNPITNPANIYWDKDFLYPAAQPIRTIAGSPNRNGAPSNIYIAAPYSLLIQNKNNVQIYYSLSSTVIDFNSDDSNLVIEGDFQIFNTYSYFGSAGDPDYFLNSWVFSNSGLDWNYRVYSFDIDQTDVPGQPKHYMKLYTDPVVATSDYYKMCFCIEDLYTVYGQYLTLSFYARLPSNYDNDAFSTSFTIKETNAGARTTGINVQKHSLTSSWQKFTTTFKVPEITTSILPYPANKESALIFNVWVNAGSDYDNETNGLSFTGTNNGVEIADIRIERGSIANQFIREPIETVFNRLDRRWETSYDDLYDGGQDGYIEYIAAGANTFIPGMLFRAKKRTDSATIQICSQNSGAINRVFLVGTGDIVVSSVGDISYFGFGQINLATPTVANNVYKYHYIVNDEITL